MSNNISESDDIAYMILDITIIQGRKLVVKDVFSSDPYAELYYKGKKYGQTAVIKKTLAPTWNHKFTLNISKDDVTHALEGHEEYKNVSLRLFDKDLTSSDDFMGESIVALPFAESFAEPQTSWYPVGTGVVKKLKSKDASGEIEVKRPLPAGTGTVKKLKCKNASGEIEVKLSLSAKKMLKMVRGNTCPLPRSSIQVSLQWQVEDGKKSDLDTSCVAIDTDGNILMDETVYYGDLMNSNGSVIHSGDARKAGLGETVNCDLELIPASVRAMYFIVTVATDEMTLQDVKTASVKVIDTKSNVSLCQFIPGLGKKHTAMFLMRFTRERSHWTMTIIEDMTSARDFGTLIPEIKGYSNDICPDIKINPREAVAVMRKGELKGMRDYGDDKLKEAKIYNTMPEFIPVYEEEVTVNPFTSTDKAPVVPVTSNISPSV